MPKPPKAAVIHASSGRTRIRIPAKRGDARYFASLEERLAGCKGIQAVSGNALTGSLLLIHRSGRQSLYSYAEENGLFSVASPANNSFPLAAAARKRLAGLGRDAGRFSADLSGLTVMALVGLSIYQVLRGNFKAPAWYTSLWYAYNIGRTKAAKTKAPGQKG